MLKALAGKLAHSGLQVNGDILYNGTPLTEFLPQRTAVYVEQEDQHLPELTVRETFDFAARCQGVGGKAGMLLILGAHVICVWCRVCGRVTAMTVCDSIYGFLQQARHCFVTDTTSSARQAVSSNANVQQQHAMYASLCCRSSLCPTLYPNVPAMTTKLLVF